METGTGPEVDRGTLRRRTLTTAGLILATVVLVGVIAWVGTRSEEPVAAGSDWAGTVLGIEQAEPAVVLSDTAGQPFDLTADTVRPLTLLMFGYTNCPDVCPISLGTLASALRALPPDVSHKVQLVFVTADPERDSGVVLRDYLDQFDTDFVGLVPTAEQLAEAQRLANVPPAVDEEPDEDGSYAVGHATQMIAYQGDGTARIVYPFGTREGDWMRDLPRLVAGERPS